MKNPTLCTTKYCRNKRKQRFKLCAKCKWRELKKTDFLKYTFYVRKQNAKRRKIPFTLTLDEFRKFCIDNGYLENKGITSLSLTIDREKNELGYSYDNIRAIPLIENVMNMHVYYGHNIKTVTF